MVNVLFDNVDDVISYVKIEYVWIILFAAVIAPLFHENNLFKFYTDFNAAYISSRDFFERKLIPDTYDWTIGLFVM